MNGPILFYGLCAAATICISTAGLTPKWASFNQSSQGHQNALAAAETCLGLEQVKQGIQPVYAPTGDGLPPGTYLCDAMGNTAQVGSDGLLGPVSTGQPELLRKKLADRGLHFSNPTPPVANNDPNK